MKKTLLINAFNAGELSPAIDVRADIDKYISGCKILENMMPRVEGLLIRMPGTKFVASAKKFMGEIVQIVKYQTGSVATGTGVIPYDDTIPQNTEGDQYMSSSIAPTDASNILKIDVVAYLVHNVSDFEIAALFRDNILSAFAVGTVANYYNDIPTPVNFTYFMIAGTTNIITFKVRGGAPVAGTTTFNGAYGARKFGGVMASSITITEIQLL